MSRPRAARVPGPSVFVVTTTLVLLSFGCKRDLARDEASALVVAFDDVMRAEGEARVRRLAALRASQPTTLAVREAREACLEMFDALAQATLLEDRLEPMARDLEALARADAAVPEPVQRQVIALYHQADSATREAELALPRCVERIDGLRLHAARRR